MFLVPYLWLLLFPFCVLLLLMLLLSLFTCLFSSLFFVEWFNMFCCCCSCSVCYTWDHHICDCPLSNCGYSCFSFCIFYPFVLLLFFFFFLLLLFLFLLLLLLLFVVAAVACAASCHCVWMCCWFKLYQTEFLSVLEFKPAGNNSQRNPSLPWACFWDVIQCAAKHTEG